MYISNCNLVSQKVSSLFIVIFLLFSPSQVNALEHRDMGCKGMYSEENARYQKAVKLAKKNDAKGLIALFEIARGTRVEPCVFAELSESANEDMTEILLLNYPFWIRTFANFDKAEMQMYIANGGLASINEEGNLKRKKTLLMNLEKYHGTKKEGELKKLLIIELR